MFQKIKKHLFPFWDARDKLKRLGFEKMGSFNSEDVFIVGYPKSGTTLLQFTIAHLVYGFPPGTPVSLINSVVTEYYKNPYFFRVGQRHFFKSHQLPQDYQKKVIYIVRDGRDAVLSYYHMLSNMNEKVDLRNLLKSGGDSFVGTWRDHVSLWTTNDKKLDVLIIKFEDLIGVDTKKSVLIKIGNFLELEDPDYENVEKATSVESMKIVENDFSWKQYKSANSWKDGKSFVRKGQSKSYLKENVPSENIQEFERVSKDMLEKYGYK